MFNGTSIVAAPCFQHRDARACFKIARITCEHIVQNFPRFLQFLDPDETQSPKAGGINVAAINLQNLPKRIYSIFEMPVEILTPTDLLPDQGVALVQFQRTLQVPKSASEITLSL